MILTRFLDEDIEMDNETLDQQASKLGCIEVWVMRATRRNLSEPVERGNTYTPLPSQDVSRDVVKKKNISHAVA